MDTERNKEFYQGAMRYGTMLGAIWSITYLLLFVGAANTTATLLFSVLYIASPFIATRLAVIYRKKECNDTMGYVQAWVFVWYMYICATLLSTLTSYIYFAFIDGGAFYGSLEHIIGEGMKIAAGDEQLTQQLELARDIIGKTTTKSFVWNIMSTDLFNSAILPVFIALFVKRKNKE